MYLNLGLKHAWTSLRQHKILFLVLILLQFILIFLTLTQVIIPRLVTLAEKVDTITTGLETATIDADQIQSGQPFLEDIALIQAAYAQIIASLQELILLLLLFFALGNGLLWILSHHIIHDWSWRKTIPLLFHSWLKYLLASAAIFMPFFLLVFFILRSFITAQGDVAIFEHLIKGTGYLTIVLYYFLLVAFAVLHLSWKEFGKRIFLLAIRQSIKTLLLFLLLMGILSLAGYGLYLLVESDAAFSLILIATVFYMTLLVCTRLYWIATLEVLAHEKDHS